MPSPINFGEYLALNNNVQIIDIENYDIARSCEFLDKAYDFTPHKFSPAVVCALSLCPQVQLWQ